MDRGLTGFILVAFIVVISGFVFINLGMLVDMNNGLLEKKFCCKRIIFHPSPHESYEWVTDQNDCQSPYEPSGAFNLEFSLETVDDSFCLE